MALRMDSLSCCFYCCVELVDEPSIASAVLVDEAEMKVLVLLTTGNRSSASSIA